MTSPSRYHRQSLLPQIGSAGQERLARARVLLVGCGALGTTIADQLVRAGVGHLIVAERDVVEATNLQRQTLFDERDAAAGVPKAVAAADRLRAVNSAVEITPVVTDVHSGNIESLSSKTDLILDGTDNVSTRYLINDVAVKHELPWVYGAAVATEGRVMAIVPGQTPCLRCIFPSPPAAHELPTCDTAGVLGMGAAVVGAFQAMQAIKILVGATPEPEMLALDFWPWRIRTINTADARRADCPCCGRRDFEFLAARPDSSVTLCGRNAIQIRPTRTARLDLAEIAERIRAGGRTEVTPHLVRCHLLDPVGVTLTVFADGRTLVQGVTDPGRARALHARWVGA